MNEKPSLRELVIIGTVNRLKTDASKSYLGPAWWLLEPFLLMLVYYTVFGVLLELRSADFTAILLIGVMTWQWISRSLASGANSLLTNTPIISTYNVNYMLFPLIALTTEAAKSICVFSVLLLILPWIGAEVKIEWAWYPLVLVCAFILISGVTLCLALLLPFFPDSWYIINAGLMALMFGSGIFYSVENIPVELQQYFLLNPVASVIHAARTALIHGDMPSLTSLSAIAAVGGVLVLTACHIHRRFEHHYFHLASVQ